MKKLASSVVMTEKGGGGSGVTFYPTNASQTITLKKYMHGNTRAADTFLSHGLMFLELGYSTFCPINGPVRMGDPIQVVLKSCR